MVELKEEATVHRLFKTTKNEHFTALKIHIQECKRAVFMHIFNAKNNLA